MADRAPVPPEVPVQELEPAAGAEQPGLKLVARLHRRVLPHTSSSRAGGEVLTALYRTLVADPAACVLLAGAAEGAEGAVASGTVALRATEAAVRRALRAEPRLFLRLALRNLGAPFHVLARLAWEKTLPAARAGYILTIGATPGSRVRGAAVLHALERRFSARGAAESWVDTEASNERAIGFYLRNGYELVSRRFGQVLLRKRLADA